MKRAGDLPSRADGFVGCQAAHGLQSAAEVVGGNGVAEVVPQRVVAVLAVTLSGRFVDGAVHPSDLTVGPKMLWCGEPVLDIVVGAGGLERLSYDVRP